MARDEIRATFSQAFQRGGVWLNKANVTLRENNALPTGSVQVHTRVDNRSLQTETITGGAGVIEIVLGNQVEPFHIVIWAHLGGADRKKEGWVMIPSVSVSRPTRIITLSETPVTGGKRIILFQLADDAGTPISGVRTLLIEDPTEADGFNRVSTNADGFAEYDLNFLPNERVRHFNVSIPGTNARILKTVYR